MKQVKKIVKKKMKPKTIINKCNFCNHLIDVGNKDTFFLKYKSWGGAAEDGTWKENQVLECEECFLRSNGGPSRRAFFKKVIEKLWPTGGGE